jgi:tRNA (uracil-5-)-methyltransferase
MASVEVNANEAAGPANVATLGEMNDEALKTEDPEKEDSKCAAVDKPGNERSEDAVAGNEESGDRKENGGERSFDHTNRKVIVQNVLKFLRNKEIEKLTKTWLRCLKDPNSIRIEKFKKPPTESWVMLTLEHEDMVQPFLDHMSANNFTNRKGKPVYAVRADSKLEGRDDKKRKNEGEEEQDAKRRKTSGPKTKDEIRDAITPLWRLPYEEQIQTKQREMIKKCAMKIIQEVKSKFRNLEKEARRHKNREAVPMYEWVKEKRAIEVLQILPSPKITEYRNKIELNFGYRHDIDLSKTNDCEFFQDDANEEESQVMRKIPSVGFMASGWSGGVSSPHILANIPSEACAIADIVEEFLATSPIPPYDSKEHRGLWRMLTIRISERTRECMLIIMHAPPSGGAGAKDDTDDYSDIFESEKARLLSMLTGRDLPTPKRDYDAASTEAEGAKKLTEAEEKSPPSPNRDAEVTKEPATTEAQSPQGPIQVTSVYFQEYSGLSNPGPEHPVQHAFGKKAIQEQLGKCTFQVSPGAFFQVNTEGAERLYNAVVEKVREACPNPEETLLFDVCCGTGTIGLTCMKEGVVGRVVGVDISEPAIEDAKINAELNGFGSVDSSERTRFVAARAEHVLLKEIRKEGDCVSVVAVVDPAREGLHSDVVRTLRMNEKIKRLVYVSCNPTSSLVRDAGLLCAPPTNKYPGRSFRPTWAQPVDMFPLTPHCEMVMTFDRLEV